MAEQEGFCFQCPYAASIGDAALFVRCCHVQCEQFGKTLWTRTIRPCVQGDWDASQDSRCDEAMEVKR